MPGLRLIRRMPLTAIQAMRAAIRSDGIFWGSGLHGLILAMLRALQTQGDEFSAVWAYRLHSLSHSSINVRFGSNTCRTPYRHGNPKPPFFPLVPELHDVDRN